MVCRIVRRTVKMASNQQSNQRKRKLDNNDRQFDNEKESEFGKHCIP